MLTAIRWQNDMVMVFDEDGQQCPSLQGPFKDVCDRLTKRDDVSFMLGTWLTKNTWTVTREEWIKGLGAKELN